MAPKKLTEYERRRIENIKRNDEMLAALKVHSRISELSAATKHMRAQTKSYKVSPNKKLKTETPIVIRRSLRTRGIQPDASTAGGLKDDSYETLTKTPNIQTTPTKSSGKLGPLPMRDAYTGIAADRKFKETILIASKEFQFSHSNSSMEGIDEDSYDNEKIGCTGKTRVWGSVDLESLELEPENVARVVPGKILAVRFFPSTDMRMIAVGNKYGNVGFWNVDCEKEDGDGIYVYRPHPGPISGIVIQPFSMSKIFTCCYEGYIRLMDVEKETFDLAYYSDYPIFSVSQRPNDTKSLYFGEGRGGLGIWDERTGKSSSSWILHEERINTIDFNSGNTNIMVTSSTDGTACIWDLRNIAADKPKSLNVVWHNRAVHSAYFSPSGSLFATTSIDDKVGLLSGANYEDVSEIYHFNQTGRWISSFRAIWGWDDSYLFIGNMKRGVDVISATEKKNVATLKSPHMSAIPCRFDAHPYNAGMLAGATSGGQVYMWTS